MINHRRLILSVSLVTATAVGPGNGFAQNSVGDALGRIISPAIGPILERAADEAVTEGIRRGYERGRILPLPGRRRPSPRPIEKPTPYPVEPTPVPRPSPRPSPIPAPAAEPPQNQIPPRPAVSPNLPPGESILTHVVVSGPALATDVIRAECDEVKKQIDLTVLRYADASMKGSSASQFRGSYRALVSKPNPDRSRTTVWESTRDEIEATTESSHLASLLKVADQADLLAANAGQLSHQQTMDSLTTLRSDLIDYRGTLLAGTEMAILAERVKNLRNFAVLSELVRVLGVQRRSDLLGQFAAAAFKADAPDEAVTTLLGMPMGHSQDSVADMQLPEGIPAVVVFNPLESPGEITFVCDDELELTLGPGELVPFGQTFVVRFDNGLGETNRYTLAPGLYRWVIDQQRWDIRKKTKIRLTIDASDSPVAFHYLLNGEPIAINPGQSIDHELAQPPRVDFDLGLGDGTLKSSLLTPGHYVVGINPETSGWDLYHQRQAETVVQSPSAVAVGHLRQSILRVRRSMNQNPTDSKVDSLLNAIE